MEHLILEILLENLTLQSMNSDNLMFRTQEKIFTASQSDIKKITTLMEAEMDLSVEEISNRVAISKRTLTRIIQSRDRSIA